MNIVIAGPKGTGKSTLAKKLGKLFGLRVVETDTLAEQLHAERGGGKKSCREICRERGEDFFRALEAEAAARAAEDNFVIIATGGSTLMNPESRRLLRSGAILVLLDAAPEAIMRRTGFDQGKIPGYLKSDNPRAEFAERIARIREVLLPYADLTIDTEAHAPDEAARLLSEGIAREIEARNCSFSSFGTLLRLSTFGESHGPALGAVLDGVRPGVELSEADIQKELDRRRPGQSAMTTARREPDRVEILSGVFAGKTTGAPIAMLIRNQDQDSSKYDSLRDLFRPGHADFTFWKKYGLRDHRGGGRSSGRETAARVLGGAVARKILSGRGISFTAYAAEVAGVKAEARDLGEIEKNPLRAPDAAAAKRMEAAVAELKAKGDSAGGVVELVITGCPAGLGDPVFGKLDARLGGALFSLGAVKGVEFGLGFAAARLSGSQMNDPMRTGKFASNHAGGILGGISSGEDIIVRIAVKPTPSVTIEQDTATVAGGDAKVTVHGRHDPCIVPRIVPVVEAMAALVLLDLLEIQERLRG